MRHATLRLLAHAAILVAAGANAPALHAQEAGFPHERHERLFPLCSGCHDGITTGDVATAFPAVTACASCHDGNREERVDWNGPRRRASTLVFSHVDHQGRTDTAGESVTCQQCHGTAPGAPRMSVAAATPESCLGCHAHEASEHLAVSRDCLVCHAPRSTTPGLPVAAAEAFSRPTDHDAAGFVSAHGTVTARDASRRCSVCHARDSCTVCHLNAQALPAVLALPPDVRGAARAATAVPTYPTPASHREAGWESLHATAARLEIGRCANCHARSGCRACHRERSNAEIAALPEAEPGDPRGVRLARVVHAPWFETTHRVDAASAEATCSSCHRVDFCSSCHASATAPVFHLPNFLATHGPQVYRREADCVSCHNTEVFCRACHASTGLAASDRLGVAFHTANPFWLVGHGVAARQALESCVTCHAQQSCMRCHSTLGAWRVSPHPPGFNARRAESANALTCLRCHRSGP